MNTAESRESQEVEKVEIIGIAALRNAYHVHNTLGTDGLEKAIHKNRFGDIPYNGDTQCEEAVLGVLKKAKVPIVVHSEEHGITQIGESPEYLAVLDGIDGSSVYKNEFGTGRYATMFGIFSGTDPQYNDYLFSGIMEHATSRLFYAVKGKGAFVLDLKTGETRLIHCRNTTELDPQHVKILASALFDKLFNVHVINDVVERLPEFKDSMQDPQASAEFYSHLANGEDDVAIECTRKENLEIAVAYGLITEAGGVMVTEHGENIGTKKYLGFGQGKKEYLPVLTVATEALAHKLVERLSM